MQSDGAPRPDKNGVNRKTPPTTTATASVGGPAKGSSPPHSHSSADQKRAVLVTTAPTTAANDVSPTATTKTHLGLPRIQLPKDSSPSPTEENRPAMIYSPTGSSATATPLLTPQVSVDTPGGRSPPRMVPPNPSSDSLADLLRAENRFLRENATATFHVGDMPSAGSSHASSLSGDGGDALGALHGVAYPTDFITNRQVSYTHSTSRMNIFQNEGSALASGGKQNLQTEQVMLMHTLKTKLSKYQGYIERAFMLIKIQSDEAICEGCAIIAKIMMKAWVYPRVGHDLAYGLCDYLRDQGYFEMLVRMFLNRSVVLAVRTAAGRALEECLSAQNRDFIVYNSFLDRLVGSFKSFALDEERMRISIALLESMFKHSPETCMKLIDIGAVEHILTACKANKEHCLTMRHASLALANLTLYSDSDCYHKIHSKSIHNWLFLLATQQDDITRYYACMAVAKMASQKDLEAKVKKCGTLGLVDGFLTSHKPDKFAVADYRHSQGRPKEWLVRLLPMMTSKVREARCLAAFHFCMETYIRKEQHRLEILQEIGAIEALRDVASSPDNLAAKFARQALTLIGEETPYKLTQQVPLWTIEDVKYWVSRIGFEVYAKQFETQMVDGDLLLLLTEKELENDVGMTSGLLRKRFIRELETLKIAADYSCVDETQLDQFLMSLAPELSVYTYRMLSIGLDRGQLPAIDDRLLLEECKMENPIHRSKLIQATRECKRVEEMEIQVLSQQIDIFISYRRSTGNQLASLIKVLLQLRGYKVFLDVDRLTSGKFDASLFKNIQAAKHFVLIATPQSLDRLIGDDECEDWVHKELKCAFEYEKNIIPVFDPLFDWPGEASTIPEDVRQITRFNGVRWVHEYQEACVDKVERFLTGELNSRARQQPPTTASSASVHDGGGNSAGGSSAALNNDSRRSATVSSMQSAASVVRPSSAMASGVRFPPTTNGIAGSPSSNHLLRD